MQFTSLKLAGFKSFIDPAEFRIEPGLTGVVGPNGCGKSNILESLRWVMGANSAKAMRAGAMDEVIFSGSTGRPARNHAEVVLIVDNADRTAPARFNDCDVLEVSRRITRGAGSTYRINGAEVRARDVQLLFADASSGANSPALVRQGQISELIAAKPQNRRRVLEEAAGISGLHNRRHEAELRLRAAENNLSRLDDVFGEIEAQHAQLKRQVRAATRYRNLSAQIRALEAFAAHLRWNSAKAQVETLQAELQAITGMTGELASAASAARTLAEQSADGMDTLRQEEAIAAALVARTSAAVEAVERDAREAQSHIDRLSARLEELSRDREHEETLIEDGKNTIIRLEEEERALQSVGVDESAVAELTRRRDETAKTRAEAEAALSGIQVERAGRVADRRAAEQACAQTNAQMERAQQEVTRAEATLASLAKDTVAGASYLAAQDAVCKAEQTLESARQTLVSTEKSRLKAEATERSSRDRFDDTRRHEAALQAETDGLSKALQGQEGRDWPEISEQISVTPGYERALAVALGDDLQASSEEQAPIHWHKAPEVSLALPEGAGCMAEFVKGPDLLTARLSQTGLVDADKGPALSMLLKPGQRLVSQEGNLWRWDGLRANADAPAPAALRLEQRNRLAALEPLSASAADEAQTARQVWLGAKTSASEARSMEKAARKALPELEQAVRLVSAQLAELDRKQSAQTARAQAQQEALIRWQDAWAEAQNTVAEAEAELAALPDQDIQEDRRVIIEAEEKAGSARAKAADADGALRALVREAEVRAVRLAAIEAELGQWRERTDKANARIETLLKREQTCQHDLEKARSAPDEIRERRAKAFAAAQEAEERRTAAADKLAQAESKRREAESHAREAEAEAAKLREQRAGGEARLQSAQERLAEIVSHTEETLHCAPESLAAQGETLNDIPADVHIAEQKLETLRRHRDGIGPVNLRAAEEAEEAEERLKTMGTDRDDLMAAIAKLRLGIESLNAEGRTRLLSAFDEINGHFQSLFLTLFGGGQAELRLTESDDPLDAGLEIYASPPGKKLDTMSLLSGGEQSLTAVALIFAVFLSNPAPVCVLDEVEAPLDDANVNRFCVMLDEMRRRTNTRFVIITHNPVTMSRVDRLYGVTMAERGVSQLVSVDLQRAETLAAAQ
ncbi:MAG: chromosome segregation protein SMC [Robiginitomaculum sp.]|nr:MAG: chromosome segregation protein SMC [Robiginitomaculum sp.]